MRTEIIINDTLTTTYKQWKLCTLYVTVFVFFYILCVVICFVKVDIKSLSKKKSNNRQ